jgi:hypothetical protein
MDSKIHRCGAGGCDEVVDASTLSCGSTGSCMLVNDKMYCGNVMQDICRTRRRIDLEVDKKTSEHSYGCWPIKIVRGFSTRS